MYFHNPRAFMIEALLQELFAARDSWRQLSYAEIEQMTGRLSVNSCQQVADRRALLAGPAKSPLPTDPLLQ